MSEKRRGDADSGEYPPFSRLFIICSRHHTENDFRDCFSKFGTIEDIWFVKDRMSGEKKGILYLQFARTSEAAKALESMNGKNVGNSPRPVKVMVASSKCEGPVRDNTIGEKYVRLFVMIPKTMNDTELHDEFSKFGKIDSATVIRDRDTRESKGYGYVKFKYFSEAAKAFENADKKYKAIFAEPKKHKTAYDSGFDNYSRYSSTQSSNPIIPYSGPSNDDYTKLNIVCNPMLQQHQLWKLFDIIPGLELCQYKYDERRPSGLVQVAYTSHLSAKYAKEKLHGFEYPPGSKLIVKPDYDNNRSYSGNLSPNDCASIANNLKVGIPSGVQDSVVQLAETIAHATSLIQAAAAGTLSSKTEICNVKLPPAQPIASIDAPVAQRCFLVCQPHPPPISVLRDVFSRFGDLIDVYTLPHKNVGFVKYASVRSAQDARKTLHGAEICGIRVKVLEAEERVHSGNGDLESSPSNNPEDYDDRRKRLKMDDVNQ